MFSGDNGIYSNQYIYIIFIWYVQDPCWLMTGLRVVRTNTHWGLSYTITIRIYVYSTTSSLIAWTGRRSTCLVWNSTKRGLGVTFFSVVALLDIPQVIGMKWPRANVMSQDFREQQISEQSFLRFFQRRPASCDIFWLCIAWLPACFAHLLWLPFGNQIHWRANKQIHHSILFAVNLEEHPSCWVGSHPFLEVSHEKAMGI